MSPYRVAVVGGGITGLAAALHLHRLAAGGRVAVSVTVLEADRRLGGKIRTDRVGDLILERGPDSFVTEKPWARELAERLGLGDALTGPPPSGRRVFVVRGRRLRPLPLEPGTGLPLGPGALWSTPLLSPLGKLRAVLEPLIPPMREAGDVSVARFFRRRLGWEASRWLVEPLLAALYGGDAEELSLQAVAPRWLELERRHGSLTASLRSRRQAAGTDPEGSPPSRAAPFVTLRGGMQQLVEAAVRSLDGIRWLTGVRVVSLAVEGGGRYRLGLADGSSETFDAVVLAVPAGEAARLLEPLSPRAAEEAGRIRYVPALVVALAFEGPVDGGLPEGSGFIVPPPERRFLSACTFVSKKWPHCVPPGVTLLRGFVEVGRDPGRLQWDDGELIAACRAELRELLDIEARPALVRVYRWPRALPRYEVGHLDRVARIEHELEGYPGLAVVGAAYRGLGIADCVRQGQVGAEKVFEDLRRGG